VIDEGRRAAMVHESMAPFGEVVHIDSRRSRYSTSATIDELTVSFVDGTVTRLLHKDLSPDAVLPEARGIKPEFLSDPGREVLAYRALLPDARLGTAACYASEADASGHFALLLEKVAGVELWQIGDFRVWEDVARWLPTMHEQLRASAATALLTTLIHYDRSFYETWPRRATAFMRTADASSRARLDWVTRHHSAAVDALLELPTTVIHGELYPSNILVATDGEARRICPVDWEMAAIGPALIDLAAIATGWSERERARLVEAYAGASVEHDRVDEVASGLALCRLHLCLRSLGWSEGWCPPPEHARDWLDEAVAITDQLCL
jgi:hypothetical protein